MLFIQSQLRLQGLAHNQREGSSNQSSGDASAEADCAASLGSRGCRACRARGRGDQGSRACWHGHQAGAGSRGCGDRVHSDEGLGDGRSRNRGGVLCSDELGRGQAEEGGEKSAELHFRRLLCVLSS